LAPTTSWEDIILICEEAIEHKTASVCIPPSYVKRTYGKYGDALNICTVIGFPLGYNTVDVKRYEITKAIEDGAVELDVVINQGDVKNKEYNKITTELAELKKACGDKILKVIVETCNLTTEEKEAVCKCVTDSGADYIKTSTGFGTGGATLEDVELFKKHIGYGVKIKASGGIRTREAFETYIDLGCTRLGTSSAVKVLTNKVDDGTY